MGPGWTWIAAGVVLAGGTIAGGAHPVLAGPAPTAAERAPAVEVVVPHGDRALLLAWLPAVSEPASPVLSYRVEASADGAPFQAVTGGSCAGAASSPCVVSNLTTGSAYRFRVTAVRPAGQPAGVAESDPVAAVTAPATVGAPTLAVAGDRALTVTWTAPAATAAAPVDWYLVEVAADGGRFVPAPAGTCDSPTASTCRLDGLTAGAAYRVRVSAVNPAGRGPASTASQPARAVAAATSGEAGPALVAGDGALLVAWTAPPTPAGDPYLVEYATGDDDYTAVAAGACARPVASPCRVDGLAPGAAYRFRVRPAAGGPPSTASAAVTVLTAPGVAGTPTATVDGARALVVSWPAPAVSAATPVDSYLLEVSTDGGAFTAVAAGPREPSFRLAGLTPGSAYRFRVTARNRAGGGETSAVSAPVRLSPRH